MSLGFSMPRGVIKPCWRCLVHVVTMRRIDGSRLTSLITVLIKSTIMTAGFFHLVAWAKIKRKKRYQQWEIWTMVP